MKGVLFKHNHYYSRIYIEGKRIHLGVFKTEKEAADAYQIALANKPLKVKKVKKIKVKKMKEKKEKKIKEKKEKKIKEIKVNKTKEKIIKPIVENIVVEKIKKDKKYYLNNEDLLSEIIKSKSQDKLTVEAEKMFILLVNKVVSKFIYTYNEDKNDCIQEALYVLFKNWKNFNEKKYTNAFAYFTEIVKRGLAKGFNDLNKKKGDPLHYHSLLSIQRSNDGKGLFNL